MSSCEAKFRFNYTIPGLEPGSPSMLGDPGINPGINYLLFPALSLDFQLCWETPD